MALICSNANWDVGWYEGGDWSTASVVVVEVVLLAIGIVAPSDDSAELIPLFWRFDALCGRTGL